ncbi:RDD family protein [Nocardioides bruguierae]|uniref:RDD family protein n=1 Tax=Nocardioides bruguierae TaxID=2945102 RepID=A0A9X2D6N3_9ACTN|nr:RDD family protein [Nocardioides bruguierae]MCL8023984.1 RDD family protein [Nocardioides bruguierae]MCM0620352.1 RDD family protein [Nocardioides bruguierae]
MAAPGSEDAGRAGFLHRLTGGVTERVVSVVDPNLVLEQIDPDLLLDRVDVDALLDRVDVNALLDRVDPDLLLDRVDPNRLLDRVDPNRLLDRVEPDALLDRVDPDRLLKRVDATALVRSVDLDAVLADVDLDDVLARVDVDALVARVDVAAILARVDPNLLLERVDLNAVLERVDLEAAVRRSGVPDLIADSTQHLAGSAIDLARRQVVALDVIVDRVVDGALRREPGSAPAGPPLLLDGEDGVDEAQRPGRRRSVTGHYAGPLSRLLAAGLDVAAVTTSYTLGVAGIGFLTQVFLGISLGDTLGDAQTRSPVAVTALLLWGAVYLFTSLAVAGRTPGKALVGLRVVAADGGVLTVRGALVRTLVLPVSTLGLGIGLLLGLVQRQHRTLHDLAARTAEVYDWGERAAELPGPLSAFLERRGPGWDA